MGPAGDLQVGGEGQMRETDNDMTHAAIVGAEPRGRGGVLR